MRTILSVFPRLIIFLFFIPASQAAIFTVDNSTDTDNMAAYVAGDGNNTFRKCLRCANSNVGLDEIQFNIASPYLITLVAAYPAITSPVFINGYSQPGSVPGSPLVVIAGAGGNGFQLEAGSTGSTISGLVIYGAQRAIYINGSSDNIISGNFIGTNSTGTAIAPSAVAWNCIEINASNNTTIGGIAAGDRNIISGCSETGIRIQGNSTGTKIYGNYIGTNVTGTAAIPNLLFGIYLLSGSSNTQIGGSTIAHRNIISGNGIRGVNVTQSTDVVVQNNFIGTNAAGDAGIGNVEQGLFAENNSHDIIVENNVVCSNGQQGIFILNSLRPVVKGNKSGMASNGTISLGNGTIGILIQNSTAPIVGGGAGGDRNYISGNAQRGLVIINTSGAQIINNYIGTSESGNVAMGNLQTGLAIETCPSSLISNNIICSNGEHGIYMSGSSDPIIKGNKVGIALDGITPLGNGNYGIQINTSNYAIIGGTDAERNIVSDNKQRGISINSSLAPYVQNNFIGVDASGNTAMGNTQNGLSIENNSNDPIILNNVISANFGNGVLLNNSARPIFKSNKVGLGVNEISELGNGQRGMEMIACTNAQIGGTLTSERNYFSSNIQIGLYLFNSPYAIIEGNYAGTDQTGIAAKGNGTHGMEIVDSKNVRLGGSVAGARNILVANKTGHGVLFSGTSTHAIVRANFVGIGKDGTTALGNGVHGIYFWGDADSATIGGSLFIERNVCSNNGFYLGAWVGAYISGDGIRSEAGPVGHTILGNYCGLDSTGTLKRGNYWAGISLNETDSCTVGGPGAFEANLCSGNLNEGIYLRNAEKNKIINNYIGTNALGATNIGNEDYGINIGENWDWPMQSFDNVIGGDPGSANIIAFNVSATSPNAPGVYVGMLNHRNLITYNKIFCNGGKGIQISGAGNEGILAPTITETTMGSLSGTATTGNTIHIYYNDKTGGNCDCEGEIFIAAVPVVGGMWTYTASLSGYNPQRFTATQTNPTNSTSEFSTCSPPLPVVLLYFNASAIGENSARLLWATAEESSNEQFIIQRSTDGINFEIIGYVKGKINSSTLSTYSFIDQKAPAGLVYYKFEQVDLDGKSEFSPIREVSFDNNQLVILPGGMENNYAIVSSYSTIKEISYYIISSKGQILEKGNYVASQGSYSKELDMHQYATSIYILKIVADEDVLVQKVLVK